MNTLAQTYLINEELLKLYSDLTRNVGVDKVLPYIAMLQPFYIDKILGKPLLDELTLEIYTDTLTDVNKALVIKIALPLLLWTEFLAARSLAYTITEKGITKEHSENSESLQRLELGDYINSIEAKLQMATELLIAYLKECKLLYPLWQENLNLYKKPNTLIYFPSSRNKPCKIKYKIECPQNGEPVDIQADILTSQNSNQSIKPCNCQNK